jgi:PAS domain S-box-containing protein
MDDRKRTEERSTGEVSESHKHGYEPFGRELEILKGIMDSLEDGVCVVSEGHEMAYVNQVIEKRFGPLNGKKCYEYFHGGGGACSWCRAREVLSGKALRWEWCSPVTGHTYDLFDAPIRDAKGNMVRLQVQRNITKRKEMEDSLRESEGRYRRLAENARDLILRISLPGGTYEYVSPASLTITGYSPEEFYASPGLVEKLIHPDWKRHVRDCWCRLLSGEEPPSCEYQIIHKSGAARWLNQRNMLVKDENGIPVAIEGIITDVTERKEAEKALRESEEKYRTIIENSIEGVFQTTPEGRYITVNSALARMFGYDSPEDLIKDVTNIGEQQYVKPEDREKLHQLFRDHGSVQRFEAELSGRDGRKVWISMNARAVRDKTGTILYYEGTTEDITERKNLEAQLRQAQKMEAIGQLAGGIAHDFNNILTTILGYGTLIQMKLAPDDPSKVYLQQMLSASEKAAGLTQSLLAFSRKQSIELKPRRINTLIRGIEKLLKRLVSEDIELKVLHSPEDICVMADTSQFDQVLMNLVTNARDAMPTGGSLTIKAGLTRIDSRFIASRGWGKPGAYALISVSDTGCGIDTKMKEKIFEPFYTTKGSGKGTGLGLAIVYGIVKQHNGFIDLESEPGTGTTFHVYLPATRAGGEEPNGFVEKAKGGEETILIAEDNPDVRTLNRLVLAEAGYTVIEAADGEEAVKRFMEQKDAISLLILDVVMPKKNGKEAYDEIRKAKPGVKVLFTSGYTGDVVLEKGLRETADFASKPLSPGDLLHKIRQVLDK